MAKLTLSKPYNNWLPGMLGRFESDDVVTQSSSVFKLVIPNDYNDPSDVQGWSVTYKAAKSFGYSAGDGGVLEPVSGKVASVEVRDDNGALVMKITDLKGVEITDIYNYIVNRPDSPGSDARMVMEYLMRGNDTLTGTNGDDSFNINENFGNDVYKGRGGNDYFEIGAGNDKIDGGNGFDNMSYSSSMWQSSAIQGAVINLKTGTATDPWGGTDTFKNVEMFEGSRFADTFIGPQDDPTFYGLKGGRGADTFKLDKDSNVYLIYESDHWNGGKRGIVADLGGVKNKGAEIKGTIKDGFGHTDKTVNATKVEGTQFNDKFKGSILKDHFNGREGTDQYDGGKGVDWLHFDSGDNQHGITVNLGLASGQIVDDGFGNTETAKNIEAILGSFNDDVIIGNGKKNEILGGGGMDTITGGGGADKFIFGNHHGNGFKDVITDFGNGKDKLVFDRDVIKGLDATVRLINGDHATSKAGQSQFFFNDDDHTLYLDINGKKAGGVMQVAVLEGVTSLSKSDIVIVSHYFDTV